MFHILVLGTTTYKLQKKFWRKKFQNAVNTEESIPHSSVSSILQEGSFYKALWIGVNIAENVRSDWE